jgi:hypothetical protein
MARHGLLWPQGYSSVCVCVCVCGGRLFCHFYSSCLALSACALGVCAYLSSLLVSWWQGQSHLFCVSGILVTLTWVVPAAHLQMACFSSVCFSRLRYPCLFLLFPLAGPGWTFSDILFLDLWSSEVENLKALGCLVHGKWGIERDRKHNINTLYCSFHW